MHFLATTIVQQTDCLQLCIAHDQIYKPTIYNYYYNYIINYNYIIIQQYLVVIMHKLILCFCDYLVCLLYVGGAMATMFIVP